MPSMQLHNYLATLAIDPSSCRGFEQDALGACVGLVGWGYAAGLLGRQTWYSATQATSINKSGTLTAGPNNKSFFYTALLHRQRSAFAASGFNTPDWSKFDVSAYRWALPQGLFDRLYPDVIADRSPTFERPPQWSDIENAEKALGLTSPAGAIGKKLFKSFLARYAPALAESAAAEWAGPVSAAALYAGVKVEAFAARTHNQQTRTGFQVDKQRRDFDAVTNGAVAAR